MQGPDLKRQKNTLACTGEEAHLSAYDYVSVREPVDEALGEAHCASDNRPHANWKEGRIE